MERMKRKLSEMTEEPAICVLPGLEGTGALSRRLCDGMARSLERHIIRYPVDVKLSLEEYVDVAESQIPDDRPVLLVSVSFSGPISLRLLARKRRNVIGIVFVVTFASSPRPVLLRLGNRLPMEKLIRLDLPDALLRLFILGGDATDEDVRLYRAATELVEPEVMASRLKIVETVDERKDLSRVDVPCCYVQAAHDRVVPRSAIIPFSSVLPHLRVKIIDGPHALIHQRAGELRAVVESFLEECRRKGVPGSGQGVDDSIVRQG